MLTEATRFLAVLVAGIALTGVALLYLRRRMILDHPNDRSSHSIPTPRGGGLAVTVLCVGIIGGLGLCHGETMLVGLSGGAVILGLISWLDDLRSLSARVRLVAQLIAAGAVVPLLLGDISLTGGFLPAWVELPLVTVAWVGFINFFNFMDGIDGISGVEATSIGIGLYCLSLVGGTAAPFSPGLVIAGAATGFLVWNWHPARIFLGDVGSIPLGFLLGGLLLQIAAEGHWAAAIILPLYYLSDASITLMRRLFRGEKIWEAHREHFYQKAVQAGHRHNEVSIAITIANMILIAMAVLSLENPLTALAGAAITVTVLIGWMHIKPRHARPGNRTEP